MGSYKRRVIARQGKDRNHLLLQMLSITYHGMKTTGVEIATSDTSVNLGARNFTVFDASIAMSFLQVSRIRRCMVEDVVGRSRRSK